MRETLRKLQAAFTRPKIGHTNNMVVAVLDGNAIQFPSAEAAQFFVATYDAVPALIDELETLEQHQAPGVLERIVADLAAMTRERDALIKKVAELADIINLEVATRTRAQNRAKAGGMMSQLYADSQRRCAALQDELDALRGRK